MRDKKFPLISVVINCFNGEKYLKESIKSVLKQSYKNWEIIFWDNKSSDGSKKIIRNFNDKRIKYYFSKRHYKLYKARNLAVKKCKGDFICFLDTDDKWSRDKLKHQVSIIKKFKVDIVFSNYFIKHENNNSLYIAINKNKVINYYNLTQELLNDYFLGILTVMVRRKIFLKKKFNSKYQIIGDFDFFIKSSLKYKYFYTKEPLAVYRLHRDNMSRKKINLYIKELKFWLSLHQQKYINYNFYFIKKLIFNLRLKSFIFSFQNLLGRVVQW